MIFYRAIPSILTSYHVLGNLILTASAFFWPGRENARQEIEGAAKLPIIRSAGMKAPGQMASITSEREFRANQSLGDAIALQSCAPTWQGIRSSV